VEVVAVEVFEKECGVRLQQILFYNMFFLCLFVADMFTVFALAVDCARAQSFTSSHCFLRYVCFIPE